MCKSSGASATKPEKWDTERRERNDSICDKPHCDPFARMVGKRTAFTHGGKEVQGYAPLLPGVTGEEPAGKDNIFYETVENEQFVTLHPGEFTVYFTNDIHRPNCTMDEPVNIHKAVVKIKESLIK